jgi:hypothetical protein
MLGESRGKKHKRHYRLAAAAAITVPGLILALAGAGAGSHGPGRPPGVRGADGGDPANCPEATLCT